MYICTYVNTIFRMSISYAQAGPEPRPGPGPCVGYVYYEYRVYICVYIYIYISSELPSILSNSATVIGNLVYPVYFGHRSSEIPSTVRITIEHYSITIQTIIEL
jgi:hypothetical protein